MNAQPIFQYRWLSPLGVAVGLFLLCGAIYIFTSLAGSFLLNRYGPITPKSSQYFVFSGGIGTLVDFCPLAVSHCLAIDGNRKLEQPVLWAVGCCCADGSVQAEQDGGLARCQS